MSLASGLNTTALRLINKYGNDMTLNKVVKGTYNPATGKTGADSVTNISIKGTFELFTSDEIKGSILQGDIKVLLVTTETIDTSFKLVFNGKSYSVIDIVPSIAQNLIIIYQLQVRL